VIVGTGRENRIVVDRNRVDSNEEPVIVLPESESSETRIGERGTSCDEFNAAWNECKIRRGYLVPSHLWELRYENYTILRNVAGTPRRPYRR
jgi:hypothetical protein